jgi:hypothetical protein
MKSMLGLRVMLAMLVAVLLPLGQAHCAWTAPHAGSAPVAVHHGHHGDGCCSESEPSPAPRYPTDPCCCDGFQLPAATAPAIISVASPTSVPVPLAVVSALAASLEVQTAFVRLEPDARSGSPPDPSTAPQSPRSPPYSA